MTTLPDQSLCNRHLIKLFLCGDVMLGRGIDQILPYPSNPRLHEPYIKTATEYVELAEQVNGSISQPAGFNYIWGDALEELQSFDPDVKIINLETSMTVSDDYWSDKDIHYRMHPKNSPCLTAAESDCCTLANNHVLDWGYAGLTETLQTLHQAGIATAGAGHNSIDAATPSVLNVSGIGRVLIFAFGLPTSGIPQRWKATKNQAGINFLEDLSEQTVQNIAKQVLAIKREQDVVVASIHWGGNWGYAIPSEQIAFAHRLIDTAGVNVIQGHSSHHPKAIEIYRNMPILYGCGDFINDYEGIGGYEAFRADLSLMYFLTIDPITGKLKSLKLIPIKIKRFRANRAFRADVHWLADILQRESQSFAVCIALKEDNSLLLRWDSVR